MRVIMPVIIDRAGRNFNADETDRVSGRDRPWESEPYRLWSLWDMLRFFGALFMACLSNYEIARAGLPDTVKGREHFIESLDDLMSNVQAPLSLSLREQAKRLRQSVLDHECDVATLLLFSAEFKKNLVAELSQYLFFVVRPERKWFYLEPDKWFGLSTLNKHPGIQRDVRDACQCLALAQWTATVFHAMRILEHGLHALAARLSISVPLGLENWKNIIDQIEKAIRDLEALPKSQHKSDDLQYYSAAAIQFRYFKDAWRNHVSHARKDYDEQDAESILTHVRNFMGQLAQR